MIKYVYCLRKRADLTDEVSYLLERKPTFIRGLAKTLRAKSTFRATNRHTAQR